MKKHLIVNQKKIFYTDSGSGKAVVLLHGYLESKEIWNDFSKELSRSFRVICIDIPGHGESETLSEKHSMHQLAASIDETLNQLKVDNCFMIGHSMGGYVTLMFHELYSEKLLGFSLFHSHPYADTSETIKKRLREIELVKDGKKNLIAKFDIPNAFATDNLTKFKKEIEEATQIALKTPRNGIVANLNAMMERPHLPESLKNTKIPFLYIAGKNDNYIDFENVASKIQLPPKSQFCILEESGHMGFIEEKEKSIKIISQFLNNL